MARANTRISTLSNNYLGSNEVCLEDFKAYLQRECGDGGDGGRFLALARQMVNGEGARLEPRDEHRSRFLAGAETVLFRGQRLTLVSDFLTLLSLLYHEYWEPWENDDLERTLYWLQQYSQQALEIRVKARLRRERFYAFAATTKRWESPSHVVAGLERVLRPIFAFHS